MVGSFVLTAVLRKPLITFRRRPVASEVGSSVPYDLAMYCSCKHLSNMHTTTGRCESEVITNGRHTYCKCQRYNGPMGLQELELWGPKELRTPAPPAQTGAVVPRQMAKELTARIEQLEALSLRMAQRLGTRAPKASRLAELEPGITMGGWGTGIEPEYELHDD